MPRPRIVWTPPSWVVWACIALVSLNGLVEDLPATAENRMAVQKAAVQSMHLSVVEAAHHQRWCIDVSIAARATHCDGLAAAAKGRRVIPQ